MNSSVFVVIQDDNRAGRCTAGQCCSYIVTNIVNNCLSTKHCGI